VAGPLAAQVTSVIEAPPLDQVHWGIYAVDARDGRVLVDHQSARKFVPASNQKLLATAAALHFLGPDHRFETALLAAGELDAAGVLDGDLVLPGTGDPTLSARFWGDDRAALAALADSLSRAGVREVAGALVVDASQWDSTSLVGSWMVEDLPSSTAATGGAFSVAEGITTVTVVGGALPGEPAQVRWTPEGEDDFVVARIETVPAGRGAASRIEVGFLPQSRKLVLEGTIPRGGRRVLEVATRDPVRQAAAALARAIEEAGIPLRGGWRVAWEPREPLAGGCRSGELAACGARRVAALASPPLSEIVRAVLEPSQNWIAEQLLRSLGTVQEPVGCCEQPAPVSPRAGWEEGLGRVRGFLVDTVGIDPLDLSLRDGSGLSVQNLVTPRALVRLLDYARTSPWGDPFRSALAEPGEEDGTLENRLAGLEGRLYAKTGSLTHVATLSGYLVGPGSRTVIFSILSNGAGLPSSVTREAIDRMVRELAQGGG
jgi:D-alanyl-D-alanine carboxypeptidase/D-alanyl-D-alanine-endopeptidase (penicillin-binding protein 4)